MLGIRMLLRRGLREFSPVSMILVALSTSLGASTTVFAFMDHIWLVPLPYRDSERIVRVWSDWTQDPGKVSLGLSYEDFQTLSASSETLETFALFSETVSTIDTINTEGATSEEARIAQVTPQFFPLLGIPPQTGRWLTTELPGQSEPEAVVSVPFWRRHFGNDRTIADHRVRLGGKEYSIVGTMPNSLAVPHPSTDVWIPKQPPSPEQAATRYASCVAKMRKGVSETQVAAEVGRFFQQSTVRVESLRRSLYGGLWGPLAWLCGALVVVLLIGLLNAASLQFARLNRRWRDFGIRSALGATSLRIAAEMLVESMGLALVSGALGFCVFAFLFSFITHSWPGTIPGLKDFDLWAMRPLVLLGLNVLFATSLLGALCWCFIQRLRRNTRVDAPANTAPFLSFPVRMNRFLVSGQLTGAVVLLIATGTLTHSFIAAVATDLGYNPDGLLLARIRLPSHRYPTLEAQARVLDRLQEDLGSVSGVESVAFSNSLPSLVRAETTVNLPDRPDLAPTVLWGRVSPSFFAALQLRLAEGSLLAEHPASEPEMVVNGAFARAYLGLKPVGKKVVFQERAYRVVGIVSDVLQEGYRGRTEPAIYYDQVRPPMESNFFALSRGHIVLRVQHTPSRYIKVLKERTNTLDPEIRITGFQTMNEVLAQGIAEPRFWTLLSLLLCTIAITFSLIACHALISYTVAQRIPELAIRLTLGATPISIRRLVLRDAMLITARGVLAGLILSLVVSALFADVLFAAVRFQSITWILCLILLSGAALIAAYIPARRAAAADPSQSLKSA